MTSQFDRKQPKELWNMNMMVLKHFLKNKIQSTARKGTWDFHGIFNLIISNNDNYKFLTENL